jgi:hypothetical protein
VRVSDNESFDEYTVEEKYIMKQQTKLSVFAAGVIAMSLLLGANVASAATVTFGSLEGKAIGITDLDIDGTLYDVLFDESAPAVSVYGPFPGTFPFTGNEAQVAVIAVAAALTTAEALTVGEDTLVDDLFSSSFNIGFDSETPLGVELVVTWKGQFDGVVWKDVGTSSPSYNAEERTYATFTPSADGGPPPADNVVKVFVTGQSYDGDIGLVGADAACSVAASDAGLPGNWTAWLSDSTTDAVDRIFDAGTGYQLVDGTVIADSLADLLDGTLNAPIMVMENGDAIPGGALAVWTNTNADGTRGDGGSCDNWTTNVNTEVGRFGFADQTDETWTNSGGGQPCDVFNRLYCFADQVAPTGPVDLTGIVETTGGTDICAMVLASGQFTFSCNPNGPYSLLDLPRETDGTVKRQIYADGFFPNIKVLPGSVDETVVMTVAGACPSYNTPYQPGFFPGSAGKWINISGRVLLQNSETPICAMALANGQFGFTCDGSGSYAAAIPLDTNGQFKLQIYADGFAPTIQTFDEFSPNNDVRMAYAAECQ